MNIRNITETLRRNFTTRLAPAPTGHLHLGHVVNAIFVFGLAAAKDGRVILRMEDHDRHRSREEYAESIGYDLRWLGFVRGDEDWVYQSQRDNTYRRYLELLKDNCSVYTCDCSRKRMEERSGLSNMDEIRYDGFCRSRNLEESPDRSIRLELSDDEIRFDDLLLGEVYQTPQRQCGDMVLRDNKGNWTYQFAVTVDDLEQKVDTVIRGEDLTTSTGRQILLRRFLDHSNPPEFLHHPLLLGTDGVKLSKKNRSLSVKEMREEGLSPEAILGMAAHRAGLLDSQREWSAENLSLLFQNSDGL